MATELATAYVSIVPSMKGAASTIGKELGGVDVSGAGKRIGSSLSSGIGGGLSAISGRMGAIAGVASSVGSSVMDAFMNLSGEITDASDSAQKFASTLNFAGVGTQQIEALTKSTQDYADKTVFGLSDIRNTTAQLAANGVPNYDQLAEAAGNLTAVAGGGANEFRSVAMALTQTAGAGKLTTENWNQLSDAIPGASGKLQEAMKANGAYTGDFRDAMANGEITADEFNKALLQLGMSDTAQEAATSASTIEGASGNLEASMVKLGSTLLDNLKPAITGAMNWGADRITWFTDVAGNAIQGLVSLLKDGQFTTEFAQAFNVDEDSPIVDFLLTVRDIAIGAFDAIKTHAGAVAEGFKTLVDGIGAILAPIAQFVTDSLGLTNNLDAGANASQALGGALDAVSGTLQAVGSWLQDNAQWLSALVVGVTAAVGAYKAWQTAISVWQTITKVATGVQAAFNVVMNANPIMIVVTAIGALVAALAWFFTQTETGQQIWSAFTTWLSTAWNTIVTTAQTLWNGLATFFTTLWTGISTTVTTVWTAISGFFTTVFTAIGTTITTIWTGISTFFMTIFTTIQTIFTTVWSAISSVVMPIVQGIGTFITNTFIVLAAVLVTIWNGISSVVQTVWNAISGFLQPIVQGIATLISNVVTGIQNTWTTVWNAVSSVFQTIWNGIVSFVTPIINAISSTISTVLHAIQGVWNSVWGAVSSVASSIWNGIKSVVSGAINAVKSVIGSVMNGVKSAWSNAWNAVSSTVSRIWDGIKNAVSNGIHAVGDTVGRIKDTVMGAVSGAGEWLKDTGEQIINGLINGIGGAFGWLKDKIGSLGSSVVNWAKGVLGIHSPSKVFRQEIGLMVGKGMALGISDSGGMLRDTIDSTLDQAIPTSPLAMSVNADVNSRNTPTQAAQPNAIDTIALAGAFQDALSRLPLVTTYTSERAAAIALAPAMSSELGRQSMRVRH